MQHTDQVWQSSFGMAVSEDRLYIVDVAESQIAVCQLNGRCMRRLGSLGTENGQFGAPMGLAVDSDDALLFVCDLANNRMQVLSLAGDFAQFGSFVRSWSVKAPTAVALSGKEVAVTRVGQTQVQIFDYNGQLLRVFGDCGRLGDYRGIAADSEGNFYVCEGNNSATVRVFSSKGFGSCPSTAMAALWLAAMKK